MVIFIMILMVIFIMILMVMLMMILMVIFKDSNLPLNLKFKYYSHAYRHNI